MTFYATICGIKDNSFGPPVLSRFLIKKMILFTAEFGYISLITSIFDKKVIAFFFKVI